MNRVRSRKCALSQCHGGWLAQQPHEPKAGNCCVGGAEPNPVPGRTRGHERPPTRPGNVPPQHNPLQNPRHDPTHGQNPWPHPR